MYMLARKELNFSNYFTSLNLYWTTIQQATCLVTLHLLHVLHYLLDAVGHSCELHDSFSQILGSLPSPEESYCFIAKTAESRWLICRFLHFLFIQCFFGNPYKCAAAVQPVS